MFARGERKCHGHVFLSQGFFTSQYRHLFATSWPLLSTLGSIDLFRERGFYRVIYLERRDNLENGLSPWIHGTFVRSI